MHFAVLFVTLVTVAAATEHAFLREINSGKRSFGKSSMRFDLKRSTGTTRLNLQENKRLNANAPVYEVRNEGNGKQRLVKKTSVPLLKTRFFQDKANQGAFKMNYDRKKKRPLLSGTFRSGADWLNMQSAPLLIPSPSKLNETSYPYILEKQSLEDGVPKKGTRGMPKFKEEFKSDYAKIPDVDVDLADALKNLKSLLKKKQQRRTKNARTRRSNPVYALELLVAVDPTIWNRFYQATPESNNRDEDAELSIREHFVHIVNGMSLRYETIDDPAMNIYLTISGFIIYKTIDDTNPLPPSTNIIIQDNKEYVEADVYLGSLVPWAAGLTGQEHDDHLLVFTDYELYSGSPSNSGVAGKAYVGGVCGRYRVSINEDKDYFRTVSIASHELGHNMGSDHDGSGSSGGCYAEDKYVMAPSVTSFSQNDAYTPNPWMFSSCSVEAFKTFVSSLGSNNCLHDPGDYYDDSEFNDHASLLPGQLHTANEQCKLERGDDSYLCTGLTSPTNDDFCRRISCYNSADGYCYFLTPARGTDCGASGANTYCIDGLCVEKSSDHIQGAQDAVTNNIPATTQASVQTTVQQGGCVDTGYQGYSCSWLDDYFQTNYNAGADAWCQDPTWEARCCAYCSDPPSNIPTTTQTPESGGCVDNGWVEGGWDCDQVSAYFLEKYNAEPTSWCYDPTWKESCCATCAANGI